MIKKFIRGNKERGAEVIKALEDLGGVNEYNLTGDDPSSVYNISDNNNINKWFYDTEFGRIIQECFEEIKLEEKKVVTNKQFANWYFDELFAGNIVQYLLSDNSSIRSQMYNYSADDNLTPVKYIRINFGEWFPIEQVDII